MTTLVRAEAQADFLTVLAAPGRSPEIPESMDVYGWLVGSWDLDVVRYRVVDLVGPGATGEVHFGWVLEGRAIQDVWIAPALRGRKTGEESRMYGTTLRVYDPRSDLWHITWIDPVRQAFNRMDGRKAGEEIVQEYRDAQGARCQWLFTGITADSFHWIARESADEGKTWKLTGEFFLRRVSA
jgi:hypothetical protein